MADCQGRNCDRPTKDDAYVCDDCLDKFARTLGDVTWLDDELETTIAKQRAAGGTDGGKSAGCSCKDDDDRCQHALVPFHAKAVELRDALRHELALLVRFCSEEGVRASDPSGVLPENTIVAMSGWLLWRVDGLAFNDMAEQFIVDVTKAVRECRRVIDLPPERSYAGSCPECSRDLYHRPAATEVKCSGCGQKWDVGEVNAWMQERIREHMEDRLVTAREGATLLSRFGLETGQRTIDKWHERGKVAEAGHDAKGRRLFRWDDLLTLAARHTRAS